MTDKFEHRSETIYPEEIIESVRNLIKQGSMETSPYLFVQELRRIETKDISDQRLTFARRRIELANRNVGIGYLSSSARHDRQKELLATACIADSFEGREVKTRPLIIPVDEFYRFAPGIPSLVSKTLRFNEIAQRENPQQNYALCLSGFTDSDIFTQEVLKQVPTQNNAGLTLYKITEFGDMLWEFKRKKLPLIIEQEKGDLNAVLKKIIGTREAQEENARLLLVTGLLLQDIQLWQNLWYEGEQKGTPLYIVAPLSFHDAMNRLNLGWGHGGTDYSYRASCSLGNNDEPPFEEVELENYHQQGLSGEEFRKRVEPFLKE